MLRHRVQLVKNRLKKPLGNQRGAALMMALFTVLLIIFLAVEVSYETAVEYRVAAGEYQRLKAYYAARSGVELAMLRIQLYQDVVKQYGQQLKGQTQLVDMIWQFPFAWPPTATASMTRVDKEQIEGAAKESLMDARYDIQIASEGSKLDLNDLASPSKALRDSTRQQLVALLKNRTDQEDEWAKENRGFPLEELVNDIQDWVDPDSEGQNGGDEGSRYPDINSTFVPPNQPFKTLDELRMVRGMTDELFEILAPNVTVYGLKGINVNYADKKTLLAIDPQIVSEIADDILKRRGDPAIGPFAGLEDFQQYLSSQRVDLNKFNSAQIPLYFGSEYNFRITANGYSGNSVRQIIAVVYDFDTVKERLEKLMTSTSSSTTTTTLQSGATGPGTPATTTTTTAVPSGPKGPPRIMYWYEE